MYVWVHCWISNITLKMELVRDFVQNQMMYLPVILVIFLAILVFAFGFQSPKEPPFVNLTNEDRKQQNKKRKLKEKKPTANGNVGSGQSKVEKSPNKELKRSPQKESEQKPKEKKQEINNKDVEKNMRNENVKSKAPEEVKSKKASKKILTEKPADFDEGNWEMVPAKGDKKKKQETPTKKEKKVKKTDKPTEIEKIEKDTTNKEIQAETEKEVSVEKIVEEVKQKEETIKDPVPIIEDKKEKKKEKKNKKEKEVLKEEPVGVTVVEAIPTVSEKIDAVKTASAQAKPISVEEKKSRKQEAKAPVTNEISGNIAFVELGDTWTEAKIPKKSKKKARKDN